jgi:hypothetical protein
VADAAETIRDYVENFGAEVCTNFVAAFDSVRPMTGVPGWTTTPLPWNNGGTTAVAVRYNNNSVNVRLYMRKASEKDSHQPRKKRSTDNGRHRDDCPQCWRDDGGWVEDNAAKLKGEYVLGSCRNGGLNLLFSHFFVMCECLY